MDSHESFVKLKYTKFFHTTIVSEAKKDNPQLYNNVIEFFALNDIATPHNSYCVYTTSLKADDWTTTFPGKLFAIGLDFIVKYNKSRYIVKIQINHDKESSIVVANSNKNQVIENQVIKNPIKVILSGKESLIQSKEHFISDKPMPSNYLEFINTYQ